MKTEWGGRHCTRAPSWKGNVADVHWATPSRTVVYSVGCSAAGGSEVWQPHLHHLPTLCCLTAELLTGIWGDKRGPEFSVTEREKDQKMLPFCPQNATSYEQSHSKQTRPWPGLVMGPQGVTGWAVHHHCIIRSWRSEIWGSSCRHGNRVWHHRVLIRGFESDFYCSVSM